jgi:hypothetical protein
MTKKLKGIARGFAPSAFVIVSVVVSASTFAAQTGLNKVAPAAQTGLNKVAPAAQTGLNKVAPTAQTGLNKVAPAAQTGLNKAAPAAQTGLNAFSKSAVQKQTQCQPEINLLDYTC